MTNLEQADSRQLLQDLTRVIERVIGLGHGNELLVDPSWLIRTLARDTMTKQGLETGLDPGLEYGSQAVAEFLTTWSKM